MTVHLDIDHSDQTLDSKITIHGFRLDLQVIDSSHTRDVKRSE